MFRNFNQSRYLSSYHIYYNSFSALKSNLKTFLINFFRGISCFILSIFILFVYFSATHNFYPLIGPSMLPTLHEKGQGCYIKMGAELERGDIAAAFSNSHTRIVKRVIAIGGDRVGYYLNTETGSYEIVLIYENSNEITILEEDYIFSKQGNSVSRYNLLTWHLTSKTFETREYNGQNIQFLVVPEDHYYLLGDNRGNSSDSSWYGAINKTLIVGKVDLVVEVESFHLVHIFAYFLGLRGVV